jgi:hypothetical protein
MFLWGYIERIGIDVSGMKPGKEFSGLGGSIGAYIQHDKPHV